MNGRPVKDRQLARAVAHAYGSVLEPGRYPVGVVYLELPRRLRRRERAPAEGRGPLRRRARGLRRGARGSSTPTLAKAFSVPGASARRRAPGCAARDQRRGAGDARVAAAASPVERAGRRPSPGASRAADSSLAYRRRSGREPSAAIADGADDPRSSPAGGFYARLALPRRRSRATFLVCEGADGLYILDQHAAAERVTFERLRTSFHGNAPRLAAPPHPRGARAVPRRGAPSSRSTPEDARGSARGARASAASAWPSTPCRSSSRVEPGAPRPRSRRRARTRERSAPSATLPTSSLATMACHGSHARGRRSCRREEAVALLARARRGRLRGTLPARPARRDALGLDGAGAPRWPLSRACSTRARRRITRIPRRCRRRRPDRERQDRRSRSAWPSALGGEIVSADSVQIYRGFDVGSGKPTAEELARAPHHLVGVADPLEPVDAASLRRDGATVAIARHPRARASVPIVCGGTFLWVKALLFGLAAAPPASAAIRERHRAIAAAEGRPALHARLRRGRPGQRDAAAPERLRAREPRPRGLRAHREADERVAGEHGFREARQPGRAPRHAPHARRA